MSGKKSSSSNEWNILNKRNGCSIPLSGELVFVGKSDCDIVLDSSSVDERHAVISFSPQEGLFYIKDLNTCHGTYVNDWKIPGQTYIKLEDKNKVRFGFSSDIFTICKSDASRPSKASTASEKSPSSITTVEASNPQGVSVQVSNPQSVNVQSSNSQGVGAQSSNPQGISVQPRVLHPQPFLSDPDSESPAVLRMKYAKKHHSSTIFPLPFCSDDYKSPRKPLVARPEEVESSPAPVTSGTPGTKDIPEDPTLSSSNPDACSNQEPERPIEKGESEKPIKTRISTKSKKMLEEPIVPKVPPAPPTAFTISFDEGPKKFTPPKLSSMDRPPKGEGKKGSDVREDSKKGPDSAKNRKAESKTSPISESAAYLINRMLESQKSQEDSGSDLDRVQSPTSESERGLDSGVCDDRSECGTYTLESERKDADVEKARKMIDDVFGVKDYVKSIKISPDSSPECSTPSNSIVARDPSPVEKEIVDKMRTFTRSKGNDVDERSSQRRGRPRCKIPDQMTMSAIEPSSSPALRRGLDSPSRSASSSRTVELKKDPKVSPLVTRKHLYSRSKSNLSVASNDSEAASLNSTNYKSDTASTLKLNRAFALRRARLGIETPGVPLNLSGDRPPRVPVDHRSNHLSRSDGGRFSLRAGRGSVGSLCSASSSRKSFKEEHRRSGPPKTCSDTERAYRSLHESVNKSLANKSKQMVSENEHSNRGSVSSLRPTFGGRGLQVLSSSRNKQQANVAPIKRQENEQMSISMIETRHSESIQSTRTPQRVMSALDNLVLAAVVQLSSKLKRGMRDFLEKEQRKYPRGSDTRLMIEEILPQVGADDTRLPDNSNESPSKELSNILKNLKKIEQSLEVLTLLADIQPVAETSRCFSLEV